MSKLRDPNKDTITADEFYLISLALDVDIEEMAAYVFSDYELRPQKGDNIRGKGKLTKFGILLAEGLMTQKDIAAITKIREYRLSTLSNDETTVPLAKEVYLVALTIGKKVSDAFHFVSGHLTLKSKDG